MTDTKKPRILYLGFNRSYTNPTAELILRIMGQVAELDFYGPGFSDRQSLEKGIEGWMETRGEYDFLVVDSYILECEKIMTRVKAFMGDFIRFTPADFQQYALSYQSFFLKYPGKKIFLSNWDIYNISESNIERLQGANTYILEGGISTTNSKEQIEAEYGKPFQAGNDNWYRLVNDQKEKIISFPHFISASEFDFSPLYARPYLFNVIGAPYNERKDAKKLMPRSQKINDFKEFIRLKIKQRTIETMSDLYLNQLRTKYFGEISKSQLCFCSGGPWLYPVRKYFEIPGRGAVAVGWKCTGFENLGFEDGVNFIIARTNTELNKVIASVNEKELQPIADRGRKLVWDLHSDAARARQLAASLELIMNKRFNGSYWHGGRYGHF